MSLPSETKSEKNNDLLEVSVHPHLVGAVQKTIDRKGKTRVIPSTLVNMYDSPCAPEFGKKITVEKAYDAICHRVAAVGLFSSRFVNVDEFTRINYNADADNLVCMPIKGCETVDIYYPHDRITYHSSNSWLFECFQIQFYLEKGLFSYEYLNLPSVINIKRSSGAVQKGILKPTDYIRLRKGSKDDSPHIYMKIHFSIDDPNETNPENCLYTKNIYLKELLEVNPEYANLEVKMPQDILSNICLEDPVVEEVVTGLKKEYKEWIVKELYPMFREIDGIKIIE